MLYKLSLDLFETNLQLYKLILNMFFILYKMSKF